VGTELLKGAGHQPQGCESGTPLTLVNLAFGAFSDQRKRNQAIFEHLLSSGTLFARGLFVNPPWICDRSVSPGQRLRLVATSPRLEALSSTLTVATPIYPLPFSWRGPIAAIQTLLHARRLRAVLGGSPYLLWVNGPDYHSCLLTRALSPLAVKVVLDLSDDFTAFERGKTAGLEARVRNLVRSCDAMVAVNHHVAAKFPHRRGMVFENATDFDNFQQVDPELVLAGLLPKAAHQKYVGFTGGLYEGRVDEELVRQLLTALPEVLFVFVGATNESPVARRIAALPNARVVPAVPYAKLPTVIRSFDVAIVPHLDNELSRGNDLLKVRDYLACGVPVVSTPSSNVERFAPAVKIARNAAEFVEHLRALLWGGAAHDPSVGFDIARRESWSRTVPRLIRWLEEEVLPHEH